MQELARLQEEKSGMVSKVVALELQLGWRRSKSTVVWLQWQNRCRPLTARSFKGSCRQHWTSCMPHRSGTMR
jgi:hypothetical protein